MKELILWLGLLSCPAVIFAVFGTSGIKAFNGPRADGGTALQIARGRSAFERECAACHGPMGAGTDNGPNLISARYGPAEMADDLIRSAVLNGVPQRTNAHPGMPALAHLDQRGTDSILRFLREVQRASGIR